MGFSFISDVGVSAGLTILPVLSYNVNLLEMEVSIFAK
jgi:hypothetical protein